jgi:hypothetical protein
MFNGGEMLSTWPFLLCFRYGSAHFVLNEKTGDQYYEVEKN